MAEMLRRQLLDTSRGRIVTLLQGGGLTADDIATRLGLTRSAVRIQITAMERDGVVRKAGTRAGTTRPSRVYELTPEVEQLLSKAYIPMLTQLMAVFAEALPAEEVETLLRRTGKGLALELSRGKRLSGGLKSRVAAAAIASCGCWCARRLLRATAVRQPRIHEDLIEQHEPVSRKRVIRLMQEDGLKPGRKRFTCTTMSDHDRPVARICSTGSLRPTRRIADGSATRRVQIGESGKLYLAAMLDLFYGSSSAGL